MTEEMLTYQGAQELVAAFVELRARCGSEEGMRLISRLSGGPQSALALLDEGMPVDYILAMGGPR